jgi:hypothetical protein
MEFKALYDKWKLLYNFHNKHKTGSFPDQLQISKNVIRTIIFIQMLSVECESNFCSLQKQY